MKLTPAERETVITFDEEQKQAVVTTFNPRFLNQLERLAGERPDDVKFVRRVVPDDCARSGEYLIPKAWVKIRPPRQLSEEQIEELKQRGRALATRRNDKEV